VELRHLRYFVAIAEERSFTRAAERLWVAQPGLSTQIRQLETELGVQLFKRHTRGVDMTDVGELFLERARTALAAADAAGAIGRDLQDGVVGRVRFGLASGPRWRPTAELLTRFDRENGGVELTVLEGHGGTLWRDLRDGRLEALLAPAGHASADLMSVKLGAERWVALIGTSHRLAGIGPVDAAELEGERIAITGHRDGAVIDRAVSDLFEQLGVQAEFAQAPPGLAMYAAVAATELVALTTAPDAIPSGVLARQLDPVRTLSFELLWRGEALSPALRRFVNLATVVSRTAAPVRSLAAA
jgi:DNA-binding transcriptional LysR family regulator